MKPKYKLEQDVFIVVEGVIYAGMVTAIETREDLRDSMITYEVKAFGRFGSLKDKEVGEYTLDENHVFPSDLCNAIQIEQALQNRKTRG